MMTRPNTKTRTCPACGAQELLSVTLTVGGSPIEFAACHGCERKWWERDGESVPLSFLLGMVGRR